jgi:mRNA interferase RelE/StbE
MEVKFKSRFNKDIESIEDKNVLDSIINAIQDVENALKPQDIKGLKKMKGDKTAFRIRIGKYRIGIYIISNVVEFTRVLPRDKIYKYFPL